jgi:hypothetical protein
MPAYIYALIGLGLLFGGLGLGFLLAMHSIKGVELNPDEPFGFR